MKLLFKLIQVLLSQLTVYQSLLFFSYDYLYIYGRLSTGKKSKKLCGSSVADLDKKEYSIEATRPEPNTVTIEFTSDYSTAFSGFSIAFTMGKIEANTFFKVQLAALLLLIVVWRLKFCNAMYVCSSVVSQQAYLVLRRTYQRCDSMHWRI